MIYGIIVKAIAIIKELNNGNENIVSINTDMNSIIVNISKPLTVRLLIAIEDIIFDKCICILP
jgi:hypothetical protein